MAANNDPIYTRTPDASNNAGTAFGGTLTTATADYTGVSANHILVHTAGTNGSYVRFLQFKAIGTNTASVARVYINNGSTNGTASNNIFYDEITLSGTTAINTASTVTIRLPMEIALAATFRLYVGLGTTVAAGWICTAIAGQY